MEKTSRFNYIKKGIVGVCAATMLTGLCAGTAFAKDATNGTNVDVPGAGTTGNSEVVLNADDLQVSATVPTTIPVVISGDTVTFPTNAQITGTGKAGIVVSQIKVDKTGGLAGLTFAESGTSLADNAIYMAIDGTPLTEAGKAPTTAISVGSNLNITGDIGTLKGATLQSIISGSDVKLFDIVWTLGLDTTTA